MFFTLLIDISSFFLFSSFPFHAFIFFSWWEELSIYLGGNYNFGRKLLAFEQCIQKVRHTQETDLACQHFIAPRIIPHLLSSLFFPYIPNFKECQHYLVAQSSYLSIVLTLSFPCAHFPLCIQICYPCLFPHCSALGKALSISCVDLCCSYSHSL